MKLILLPFFIGVLAAALSSMLLPSAWATECIGDAFWSVSYVPVSEATVPWPDTGSLTPDELQVSDSEVIVRVGYKP